MKLSWPEFILNKTVLWLLRSLRDIKVIDDNINVA